MPKKRKGKRGGSHTTQRRSWRLGKISIQVTRKENSRNNRDTGGGESSSTKEKRENRSSTFKKGRRLRKQKENGKTRTRRGLRWLSMGKKRRITRSVNLWMDLETDDVLPGSGERRIYVSSFMCEKGKDGGVMKNPC